MTPEELAEAVTIFRKEAEDLTIAKVQDMFKIQYDETSISAGETKYISLSVAYSLPEDYEIKIFEATDADGVNIADALEIAKVSTSSFTIYSPREVTVRWQTVLKIPYINFWTL